MFSFSMFLQIGIPSGMLDKACSLSASFCKTAFHQANLSKFDTGILDKTRSLSAYLAKRHFTRHTTKHVFFQLVCHNGISPGILDKNDKACSLSACFWKTSYYQAYVTPHVLFQRNDNSPGMLGQVCLGECRFPKTS